MHRRVYSPLRLFQKQHHRQHHQKYDAEHLVVVQKRQPAQGAEAAGELVALDAVDEVEVKPVVQGRPAVAGFRPGIAVRAGVVAARSFLQNARASAGRLP